MTTSTKKDIFYSDTLVRFSHCDPAGIVFYPHYFVMFSALVEDWFNHGLEIDYARFITERRLAMPIVNVNCNFKAPSKIGEVITLTLKVAHIGNSSLKLDIDAIYQAEERLSAQLTMVLTTLENLRAAPIPDDLRVRLCDFQQGNLDTPWRQA